MTVVNYVIYLEKAEERLEEDKRKMIGREGREKRERGWGKIIV
jgi:hypothetical protein